MAKGTKKIKKSEKPAASRPKKAKPVQEDADTQIEAMLQDVKLKRIVQPDREQFRKMKEYMEKSRLNFQYISSGTINRLIYGDREIVSVDLSEFAGKGYHLSRMVRRDINDWLSKNTIVPREKEYKEQMFQIDAIEKNIGKPLTMIDIDECYWRTAYKLGYITKQTYIAGKRKKEWKIGRNASIGSLCKREWSVNYIKGKPDYGNRRGLPQDIKLTYVRNHIIGEVYRIFSRMHQQLLTKFFMFLTDCVVTQYDRQREVEDYFASEGYKCKSKPIEFVSVDRDIKKITWLDLSAQNKDGSMGVLRYYHYANHQVIDGVKL